MQRTLYPAMCVLLTPLWPNSTTFSIRSLEDRYANSETVHRRGSAQFERLGTSNIW